MTIKEYNEKYRLPWKLVWWETFGATVIVNSDEKLVLFPLPSQKLDVEFILEASNNMPRLLGLTDDIKDTSDTRCSDDNCEECYPK